MKPSEPRRCTCGRRIVRDRGGVLHERCGTCRRIAAEEAAGIRRHTRSGPHGYHRRGGNNTRAA